MQDGNPGQDPVCARCKQQIEIAVRTEAVYQEGLWFPTACPAILILELNWYRPAIRAQGLGS